MDNLSIKTTRLLLRRWQSTDIDPYAELCGDVEVMRWIGNGTTRDRDECVAAIEGFEEFWEQNGFGLFAVELLENRELLGFTGLSVPSFLPEILPATEIGWRLKRGCWGRGYATEAAQASLSFGFRECALNRIVGIHQAGNEASARIMEKIGMSFYLETEDPSCDRPVNVYEVFRK